METVRLLFAIAAQHAWMVEAIDIKGAFLEANLRPEVDGTIYITPPEGSPDRTRNVIWKLNKSIYGLRVAPLRWYQTFVAFLTTECKLQQSKVDPCLLLGKGLICVLFVDDVAMAGTNTAIKALQSNVLNHFTGTSSDGLLDGYIGLNVTKLKDGYALDQSSYIIDVAKGFGVDVEDTDNYPETPLPTGCANLAPGDQTSDHKDQRYRSLVACLLHLARFTRPDISYCVRLLSTSLEYPTARHSYLARRVLKYAIKSKHLRIEYHRTGEGSLPAITAYSDASWNSEFNNRSVSGVLILANQGPIVWASRTQPIVALSSAESESQAMLELGREAKFLKAILDELTATTTEPIQANVDNDAAIAIANGSTVHRRTKHFGLRSAFVRSTVQDKILQFSYINTTLQAADILTKPLPVDGFIYHLRTVLKGDFSWTSCD